MEKSEKWALPANVSDTLKELVEREADVANSDNKRHLSLPSGGKYCCVVGCSNNQARDIPRGIKFHKFPSNRLRRQLWSNAIKRGVPGRPGEAWQPGQSTVICSDHFYDGKKSDVEGSPGYVPSLFPTHHVKPKTKADEDRFKRQARFQQLREKTQAATSCEGGKPIYTQDTNKGNANENRRLYEAKQVESSFEVGDATATIPEETSNSCQIIQSSSTHPETTLASSSTNLPPLRFFMPYSIQVNLPLMQNEQFVFDTTIVSSTEKATQISSVHKQSAKEEVRKKVNQVTQTYENTAALPFHMFSDKQFSSFCGVTRNIANFLVMRCGDNIKDSRMLNKTEKMYLMLTKMKLHVPFSVIAGFFGISESLAGRIFQETLNATYEAVKGCIIWLDKETIVARMPKAFKVHFPNTRIIIDCTEIECEQPAELHQQVLMYSNYKSRYTYKFLVGIAPSGEIMFLSKGCGGRSTDTELCVGSGFLNLIEDGDLVMSDKGFPSIESKLCERGGVLVMPPFKKGQRQFSAKENKDGYECASVRVHVERAIRRLKVFKILKFIPQTLIPHVDKIVTVIAGINNLLPDLIVDDKEEDLATRAQSLSLE